MNNMPFFASEDYAMFRTQSDISWTMNCKVR